MLKKCIPKNTYITNIVEMNSLHTCHSLIICRILILHEVVPWQFTIKRAIIDTSYKSYMSKIYIHAQSSVFLQARTAVVAAQTKQETIKEKNKKDYEDYYNSEA